MKLCGKDEMRGALDRRTVEPINEVLTGLIVA